MYGVGACFHGKFRNIISSTMFSLSFSRAISDVIIGKFELSLLNYLKFLERKMSIFNSKTYFYVPATRNVLFLKFRLIILLNN